MMLSWPWTKKPEPLSPEAFKAALRTVALNAWEEGFRAGLAQARDQDTEEAE